LTYGLKDMFVAAAEFDRLLPVSCTVQLSFVTPSAGS